MNSIIWKGVSSTTINGLLISELPPISKPAMRVKETTIDGRDGSIIEDLGYSSYDKEVVIGLHGNFDINKVIKYFTGEGEVVFSNEPDKVYTAKIVGHIDYNRLLRYRQATIPFRVQPFKHKLNEEYQPAQTVAASGTSVVVNDSADANLKVFSIFGKTTQDGTPTPDAPVAMVSIAEDGSISAHICGKNLFTGWIVGGIDSETGVDVPYSIYRRTEYLPVGTATKKISVSGVPSTLYNMFAFYDADKTFVGRSIGTKISSRTVEAPKDAKYFRFTVYDNTDSPGNIEEADTLASATMLEVGDTVTEYEIGKPIQTVAISAPNGLRGIPVSSGGNYADANGQQWICDEIDLVRGVYVQRTNKYTVNGSAAESWAVSAVQSVVGATRFDITTVAPRTAHQICLCNAYTGTIFAKAKAETCWCNDESTTNSLQFRICTARATTLAEIMAYVQTNPVDVVYILATPIERPLSAEEQAACAALHTYKDYTTVSNDANTNMSVEYFKPFEVFNEGMETSKPIMVLKGEGSVVISVNGLEIFTYTFPEGENEVVIDSEKEDAYLGDVLKNRNMNGEFPALMPGTNIIEWSGYVSSIEILPRSRWL